MAVDGEVTEPSLRNRRFFLRLFPSSGGLLLALFVLTSGCGSTVRQTPPPQADDHRTIAEGYSLLYGITSQQKDVAKVLMIKSASPQVHALISEIAAYATQPAPAAPSGRERKNTSISCAPRSRGSLSVNTSAPSMAIGVVSADPLIQMTQWARAMLSSRR